MIAMKIEEFENGKKISATHALQYLLGETNFETDSQKYRLEFEDDGEEIRVTVDAFRTVGFTDFDGVDISPSTQWNCVFNQTYQNFTFAELLEDLHNQHLEEVEDHMYDFIIEKCEVPGK